MNNDILLNIALSLLLIALIIGVTLLIFLGIYWFIRFAMNQFNEIVEWEQYYRKEFYDKSEKLEKSYDKKLEGAKEEYEKKLHDETEKILIEFYRNDPNNPNNKKKEEEKQNENV